MSGSTKNPSRCERLLKALCHPTHDFEPAATLFVALVVCVIIFGAAWSMGDVVAPESPAGTRPVFANLARIADVPLLSESRLQLYSLLLPSFLTLGLNRFSPHRRPYPLSGHVAVLQSAWTSYVLCKGTDKASDATGKPAENIAAGNDAEVPTEPASASGSPAESENAVPAPTENTGESVAEGKETPENHTGEPAADNAEVPAEPAKASGTPAESENVAPTPDENNAGAWSRVRQILAFGSRLAQDAVSWALGWTLQDLLDFTTAGLLAGVLVCASLKAPGKREDEQWKRIWGVELVVGMFIVALNCAAVRYDSDEEARFDILVLSVFLVGASFWATDMRVA